MPEPDRPPPSNPHLLPLLLLLRLLRLLRLLWLRNNNHDVPVRPFLPTVFRALSLADGRCLSPLS